MNKRSFVVVAFTVLSSTFALEHISFDGVGENLLNAFINRAEIADSHLGKQIYPSTDNDRPSPTQSIAVDSKSRRQLGVRFSPGRSSRGRKVFPLLLQAMVAALAASAFIFGIKCFCTSSGTPQECELLESRVSPSHGITDHIHAELSIWLEDKEITIPANIGLGGKHYNPHTHSEARDPTLDHEADDAADSGGIIHIGEGGPAGLSNEIRYVTIEDFFDVWREGVGTVEQNIDAFFSKEQIMDRTTDQHHEVIMTVNGTVNSEFEDYTPHDADKIAIRYERTSWAWQNYDQPYDTSGDGFVSARDVLFILLYLRENGSGLIRPEQEPAAYYDVTGDDVVNQNDFQEVIAYINEIFAQRGSR